MKRLLIVLILAGLAVGGAAWWRSRARDNGASYRLASVERGTLVASITASGVLQPEEVVDVGAQVAGRIVRFGKDLGSSAGTGTEKLIDYNSEVKENQELAYIDPALYKADLDLAEAQLKQALGQKAQAKAQIEQAQANLARAQADLGQMKARLVRNEREMDRLRQLRDRGGAVSASEYELAVADYRTAQATLAVGEASIEQARAAVKDSEANLLRVEGVVVAAEASRNKAKTNLDYCVIRSPVNGVIIDRRVNVGQTVVASLNAPSLFLIAKDLTRIQIWASVNEADIAQVRKGQMVRFTVDARAGESFVGRVEQIRLNASMTQNVVTYTVVISTENKDRKLLPYQTANVTFEVNRREDVVMVPNAALRWQPRKEQIDPDHQDEAARVLRRRGPGKPSSGEAREGVVWVEADPGLVRPVVVKLGMTDGSMTEILSEELKAEDRVVTGVQQAKGGDDASPFVPRQFGSGGRRQQQ